MLMLLFLQSHSVGPEASLQARQAYYDSDSDEYHPAATIRKDLCMYRILL